MTVCDFFAGLFAGMAGLVAGYPIDTIKVRQQLGGETAREAVRNMYKSMGFRGFYRGLKVPMLANGLLNAVYFSTYAWAVDRLIEFRESVNTNATVEDAIASPAEGGNAGETGEKEGKATVAVENADGTTEKKKVTNMAYFKPKGFVAVDESNKKVHSDQATFWDCFIGGWIAGWITLSLSCPVELIKVKLQTNLFAKHRIYKNPKHVIGRVYKSQGIAGFYRGVLPMSHRNFIAAALNYSVMKVCIDLYPESPRHWYQTIPAAVLAGVVSWTVAIPLDVIKTRMQSDHLNMPRYKNMMDCAKQIVQKQGSKGLFRGLSSIAFRALPVNVTTFVIYEWARKYCGNVHGL